MLYRMRGLPGARDHYACDCFFAITSESFWAWFAHLVNVRKEWVPLRVRERELADRLKQRAALADAEKRRQLAEDMKKEKKALNDDEEGSGDEEGGGKKRRPASGA
jgi:hypothetical protein